MSQPLPTGGFKWVDIDPSQMHELAHRNKGYLLEVDVRYPTEIHDSHDELPFLSKRMEIMELLSWFLISETKPNMWST